ncbi:hypothetical protein Tco_0920245 [Tanacetum coccineum]
MGELSFDAYFHKIESIVTLLYNLGSLMSDDDVCTYAMHGLSDKFAHVAGIIAYREPLPDPRQCVPWSHSRIQKNLLDRVSQLHQSFSLSERLKADNTSPSKSLFDVGSRRISIVTVNTKEYHSDVLAIITRIMRRTL